ncbi:hypothetical protein GPECTOR_16g676 [Gonium pectorale]|uniref:DNA topoisomerase (ATP-hydrolyzing) n=1 Tax=Gonium pectorale TaxID=33097 RepID=A0A150GL31_GONPE|nr:hypothetical protein GPECTOR_16g676 [Gonium pectorale]|eukprot:KXZ50501.1 hypothetical protein GPECTOR_16g676 [Gonium pectorale]
MVQMPARSAWGLGSSSLPPESTPRGWTFRRLSAWIRDVAPASSAGALAAAVGSAPRGRAAVIAGASRKAPSGAAPKGGGRGVANGGADAAVATLVEAVERVEDRELSDEAYQSYMAYAMSVIVSRAIPDVRDGLKPVHRRILFAMHELGLAHNKPYKKCARVVGEVLGKFHPHGDTAVYDTLVRMAQWFSMRETLVDGHGNFGSLDSDPAAAMRYTECRLTALAQAALLADLSAESVVWRPTFDESQTEPEVLPAVVPNLLINGTSGIAVGIASSIPSHNLGEVVAALRALIADPDVSTEALMAHVQGPDFPTGGELLVGPELVQAYANGRGSVVLRGVAVIERPQPPAAKKGRSAAAADTASSMEAADEELGGGGGSGGGGRERQRIVITELPYQVCKSDLVAAIAQLAESKQLEGVADVRDESDRSGTRVVVDVRRGHNAELLLAQLYSKTRLQVAIHFNCVSLVGSQPRCLGLKDMLQAFLDFRCEVVTRRASSQLAAATARAHLLDGLLRLLNTPGLLDAAVATIRVHADGPAARQALMAQHGLSEAQAEAVLGFTLRRLTGLEAEKLAKEREELESTMARLQRLLSDRAALLGVVEAEAVAVAEAFPDPRRTRILAGAQAASAAAAALPAVALPPARPCLVLASRRGFLRRVPLDGVAVQNRNTRGKSGLKLRTSDLLGGIAAGRDRDGLLLLTPEGKAYQTSAVALPGPHGQAAGAGSASSSGTAPSAASASPSGASVANILALPESFHVAALLPLPESLTPPPASAGVKAAAKGAAAAASPTQAVAGEQDDAEAEADVGEAELAEEEQAGPSVVLCSRGGLIKRTALPTRKISRTGVTMMTMTPTSASTAAKPSRGAKAAAAAGAGSAASPSSSSPASPAGDELGWAALVESPEDVLVVVTSRGQAVLFPAAELRLSGRTSRGVKAVRLGSARRMGDSVADLAVLPAELVQLLRARADGEGAGEAEAEADEPVHDAEEEVVGKPEAGEAGEMEAGPLPPAGPCLLLVTAQGCGKRVPLSQLTLGRRAAAGQKIMGLAAASRAQRAAARSGADKGKPGGGGSGGGDRVVAALVVRDGEEVVLASRGGVIVRQAVDGFPVLGRYSRGNYVMTLDEGDEVAAVVRALPYDARTGAQPPPSVVGTDAKAAEEAEELPAPEPAATKRSGKAAGSKAKATAAAGAGSAPASSGRGRAKAGGKAAASGSGSKTRQILSQPGIEGDPLAFLDVSEAYWRALRNQKHEPSKKGPTVVKYDDSLLFPTGSGPDAADAPTAPAASDGDRVGPARPHDYDVVICGGTLGLFLATALQLRGWRVAIVEKRLVQGRNQEWNISWGELEVLVELGLLSREELRAAVVSEFNPIRVGFLGGQDMWTSDVLNLGVQPRRLLDSLRRRFLGAGGVIHENTAFKGAIIHPDGLRLRLSPGGTASPLAVGDTNRPNGLSGASTTATSSPAPRSLTARLLLDCMGHYSDIVKQIRGRVKPDGMCMVVGSCAEGFPAPANTYADLLYSLSHARSDMQLFWEAFPAEGGTARTTYMFAYSDAHPERPSFESLLDTYFEMLPQYQVAGWGGWVGGVPLSSLRFKRVLFGGFPCYSDGPLQPAFDRVMQIGDASATQSPLSFGGFGSMMRHLGRLTRGLHQALSEDRLRQPDLAWLHPYQPSLSASWLFQRSMSIGVGQAAYPPGYPHAPPYALAAARAEAEAEAEAPPLVFGAGGGPAAAFQEAVAMAAARFAAGSADPADYFHEEGLDSAAAPASSSSLAVPAAALAATAAATEPKASATATSASSLQRQSTFERDFRSAPSWLRLPYTHVNEILGCNFGVMGVLGDRVLRPFLQDTTGSRAPPSARSLGPMRPAYPDPDLDPAVQDTIQLVPLSLSMVGMMIANPVTVSRVLLQVGAPVLVRWFAHYFALMAYTLSYTLLRPLRGIIPGYAFQRLLDTLEYGSGSDYRYHASESKPVPPAAALAALAAAAAPEPEPAAQPAPGSAGDGGVGAPTAPVTASPVSAVVAAAEAQSPTGRG